MKDPISDSQSRVAMLREHFAGIVIKELNAGYTINAFGPVWFLFLKSIVENSFSKHR